MPSIRSSLRASRETPVHPINEQYNGLDLQDNNLIGYFGNCFRDKTKVLTLSVLITVDLSGQPCCS